MGRIASANMATSTKMGTRALNRLALGVGARPRTSSSRVAAARQNASSPSCLISGARRACVGARRVEEIGAKNAIANVGSLEDTSASSASTSTKQVTTAKAKGKYKLKTRKAAAKRFKVTGNGKVMRRKQGKQHLNTKKKTKRKRFLSAPAVVEKGDIPNIKGSMPNHKIKG